MSGFRRTRRYIHLIFEDLPGEMEALCRVVTSAVMTLDFYLPRVWVFEEQGGTYT